MNTFTEVEIRGKFIGLVIIDVQSFSCEFFLGFSLVLDHGLIESAFGYSFWEDYLIDV